MATDKSQPVVNYRPCTRDDIDEVLNLWRDSGAIPGSTDTRTALLTRLERDRELFVLAHVDGSLIGCVIGGWDGWRANMYRLVVKPPYRRQGIAGELVRIVERRLTELGAVRIYALAVNPELEPGATLFWHSMGYEVNPRLSPYVRTLP